VAGKTGYDIVVPSSNWAKLQIDGGLLRKLDKNQIPNWKNLDPAVLKQLQAMDPGNDYLVDWLWGYTTVGINVDKVKAALGSTPMPDNAWDLVFKPEYIAKMKSCGVSFLDSASEIVPAALHYLGKPSFSKSPSDYAAAAQLLKSVRPSVTLFSSSGYINDMANGSICLALGWSGDINIARQRAIDGKTGQNIQALLPKTGGLLFFDVMVIPADAAHPGNAHKWINYVLRPEVHAQLTNKVFYANPNKESKKFVKPEVAANPTVFLSDEDMKKMVPPDSLNNDLRRLMTRTFTSFKTGL
jgi:putrescine transport system substrate-binding protein